MQVARSCNLAPAGKAFVETHSGDWAPELTPLVRGTGLPVRHPSTNSKRPHFPALLKKGTRAPAPMLALVSGAQCTRARLCWQAKVFEEAEATAAKYQERLEAERKAREEAAQDVIFGLESVFTDSPGATPDDLLLEPVLSDDLPMDN